MVQPVKTPALSPGQAKPFAKSYALRRDKAGINIKRPHAASQPYEPTALCASYGWPTGISVVPQTIVICELGGKFYPADVAPWASRLGIAPPTVTTYLLPGADDSAGDADGEVALDWQLAAAAYTYLTGKPATILIVYGPNSGQAFADCMNYANSISSVGAGSWSWGSPESQWATSELAAMNSAAMASKFPWFAASGDNDSNDGTNRPVTDAPASSSYMVGCGGTTRPPNGPETVWNNGNGEGTGGGFSKVYSRPSWQPINSQGTGRMVPDLACNADPNTGYDVLINGSWDVIGGTSAVAPLMAGFFAAVNGSRALNGLAPIGLANSALWANSSSFLDVVSGNNGSFRATVGPDPCSGLGRPLGTLVSALDGSGQTPPPVPPTPIPPVPPVPPTPPSPPTASPVLSGTLTAVIGGVSTPFSITGTSTPKGNSKMNIELAHQINNNASVRDTVSNLVQQIMAAAMKIGISVLPTVLHEVAVILETDYPNEAALIQALEAELQILLPSKPA